MKEQFPDVRVAFEENLAGGADVGASFCVTVRGETVVDLYGGFADEARTRPWGADTIVGVYSTTKTMTALLAAQEPFWKPGTASGYHAMTQGYLVGEVLRRITGRSLGTVFREEIAEPLGADFHIGLPSSEDARVAELIPPPGPAPMGGPDDSELQANVAGNPHLEVQVTRTRAWRGAEIPAVGGIGNARAMAEIHAILANGGIAKGRRFMSEAGCLRALQPQVDGVDLILGVPIRFGLGFALDAGLMPHPNTLYWGGYGGSLAIIDMDAHTTIAYAMNKMSGTTTGDFRALGLATAFWEASPR